jgi:MurNAc alpha-1-phosphate uridylyltransferase
MDAMILAAGEGTRLRPLTDRLPKALVPVRGRPLLAHVMERLVAAGATRLVVNTSRHGERIQEYLAVHAPPGVAIALSPEPDGPYDTGGGLLAAAPLLRGRGAFLLHAVDILSRIPLEQLVERHREARAAADEKLVATLAVQDRGSRRQLLFDAEGLVGWEERSEDGVVVGLLGGRDPVGPVAHWSFAGIHVVEPALLDLPHPPGRFTMVSWYLELARLGYRIVPADVSGHEWLDVGTPERLREAEAGGW